MHDRHCQNSLNLRQKSLIELLSEFNWNKLTDPKTNVSTWMLTFEIQCQ